MRKAKAKCQACRRSLSSPSSVYIGIGPKCQLKLFGRRVLKPFQVNIFEEENERQFQKARRQVQRMARKRRGKARAERRAKLHESGHSDSGQHNQQPEALADSLRTVAESTEKELETIPAQ